MELTRIATIDLACSWKIACRGGGTLHKSSDTCHPIHWRKIGDWDYLTLRYSAPASLAGVEVGLEMEAVFEAEGPAMALAPALQSLLPCLLHLGKRFNFFLKIAWCMQLRLNMAVSCSARWASDVDWLLAGRVCNYILTQSNRWWHVNFFKIDCTLCNHHFSWQLKFMFYKHRFFSLFLFTFYI